MSAQDEAPKHLESCPKHWGDCGPCSCLEARLGERLSACLTKIEMLGNEIGRLRGIEAAARRWLSAHRAMQMSGGNEKAGRVADALVELRYLLEKPYT